MMMMMMMMMMIMMMARIMECGPYSAKKFQWGPERYPTLPVNDSHASYLIVRGLLPLSINLPVSQIKSVLFCSRSFSLSGIELRPFCPR